MKIDWRFILVIIAALVTILALKTQTENLDGDVESEDESEEEKEKEEEEEEVKAEVPKAAYPDVKGFIGSMGDIPGKVKYVDLHIIKGFLDDTSVEDDKKGFMHCDEKCQDPQTPEAWEQCKLDCNRYTAQMCNVGCKLMPDDELCTSKGECAEFLP
tara:strand:+ start:720 stop:1190 length:471 start_codon:yes stop_codon:yes gene_type:complete